MTLTPYQKDVVNAKICPYCKSGTRTTTETEIYGKEYRGRAVICCKNFPACDAYVGTHEDGTALGRLAQSELRYRKGRAHFWFDKIWKEQYVDRSDLYAELGDYLGLPEDYTHIGMFSAKTCMKVEEWAHSYYQKLITNGKA